MMEFMRTDKPRITLITAEIGGPARGMWRCISAYGPAEFGVTPSVAYDRWLVWQHRMVQARRKKQVA